MSLSGRSLRLVSHIYHTGKTASLVDISYRVIQHFHRIPPASALFAHHMIYCRRF